MSTKAPVKHSTKRYRYLPWIEWLEDRIVPALIASEVMPLLPPEPPGGNEPTLTISDVQTLLDRAAAATTSDDAIVAVMDRGGNVLGVRVEAGVDPTLLSDPATETFAVDGALAEARTAAYFANDTAPLTSRTIQFISQSTITQREVESSPDVSDPNSPLYGPGYVAPVGIGGHFPPNVPFTPQVDLFGIEHTNRDSSAVANVNNPATVPTNRFNVPTVDIPSDIPVDEQLQAPNSYGLITGIYPNGQGRGIGTLPGGIPLYKDGVLVGGIGVFFPGKTGYATEENSSLSATYDPSKPDLTLEAEFIAFAAAGGSSEAGYSVGTLGGIQALPGFDIPFARIDLVGVTLDVIGPGGTQGPQNLFNYATSHFSIGNGDPNSGASRNMPVGVDANGDPILFKAGVPVPSGWLVTPHDGVGITAAQVTQIIDQGIAEANQVRSQVRVPDSQRTRMVFAVTDSTGAVLGLYRMPDATVFSIGVAVAKARNTAYYDDPTQLLSVDQVPGIPAGASFTARTFRYLAQPLFPEGIDGSPRAFLQSERSEH